MPGADRDPLLEARIDAALRSYAEPPAFAPDPRTAAAAIMERARASQHRRRLWWRWGIPATAAVAAALVLVLVPRLHAPAPPSVARSIVPPPAVPAARTATPAAVASPVRAAHRALRRPTLRATRLPKQSVFPTPARLSSQEEALVVFARTAPPAVREAVIKEQSHWGEDSTATPSPIHPISQPDTERP